MIVNGGDDGDVSRLPSPPFGICVQNEGALTRRVKNRIIHNVFSLGERIFIRSVAQSGSAFASGAKGRGFKSLRSDQFPKINLCVQNKEFL